MLMMMANRIANSCHCDQHWMVSNHLCCTIYW